MQSAWEYRDAIIGLQKRKDYSAAYETMRTALTVYPTNPFFLSNEVYLLYRLNRIKEARQKAEERVEFLKNDVFFLKIYLTILEKLRAKQDIEDFIERYILSQRTGNEDLYVFVAQLTERIFGKDRALDSANRALMFFQDSAKLKELLAGLQRSGSAESGYKFYKDKFKGMKTADAIREIEGVRILPDYADDFELLAFLAELYKKQGDYSKAIDIYRQILTLRDNEFIRKMLGYAYYKSGDHKSALVYLKDFLLKNPDDHFLYSTIYNIFKETGDSEGLHRLIEEALGLHPSAKHLYGLLSRTKKWKKDLKI